MDGDCLSITMTTLAGTREASHADSWYEKDATALSDELDDYLARVPSSLDGSELPIPGARVIIAPSASPSACPVFLAWHALD